MGIRFVENFNLVPNICHKRKEDGDSRGGKGCWTKQATTVGVSSKRGRSSKFVTDGSVTLAILTGLKQFAATCP